MRSRWVPRHYPEHGEAWCQPLELRERRILVDWHVRASVRRPLQVSLQHGSAAIRPDHFFQVRLLGRPMTQGGLAPAALTFRTQFASSPSMHTR